MPKVTGPTIPRWQLGAELSRLREAAGISIADAATAIGRSESQIRKFELGYAAPAKTELPVLLALYAVRDVDVLASLERLRQAGTARGWWSRFGTLPWAYATLLGLEEGAAAIESYEPSAIPALLQTEDYARAFLHALVPDADEHLVDRQLRIRLTRQQHTLDDDPPKLRVILDEATLCRPVGGAAIMRGQLETLTKLAERHRIQVLPFRAGPHPGQPGGFTILEFPDGVHTPVVYIESQAGGLFLEKDADLTRCRSAYEQLTTTALGPRESVDLIASKAQEYGGN